MQYDKENPPTAYQSTKELQALARASMTTSAKAKEILQVILTFLIIIALGYTGLIVSLVILAAIGEMAGTLYLALIP